MKSLREIFRLWPIGQHRRRCRCLAIPTLHEQPTLRAGDKWQCDTCGQKYVAEILRDQEGRYVRWLLK